jgi:hypothetical protein
MRRAAPDGLAAAIGAGRGSRVFIGGPPAGDKRASAPAPGARTGRGGHGGSGESPSRGIAIAKT